MKGQNQMMAKISLKVGVPALLAFIACNAFLAVNHLTTTQKIAAQIRESSAMEKHISDVQRDLTDMETSQRGYLLTGDSTYLEPYTAAKGRIEGDFGRLREGLRAPEEQSLESKLESLGKAKQSEMERSVSLRQRGYRHRSFMLVKTDEGRDAMNEIRQIVSSLSSAQSDILVKLEREKGAAISRAFSVMLISNASLLLVAVCLFAVLRRKIRMLEGTVSQRGRELAERDLQLEKLTSALSGQARNNLIAINTTSRLLLENYGGFLPRQGHEYAEQMKEAAVEMEQLRQDLVGA